MDQHGWFLYVGGGYLTIVIEISKVVGRQPLQYDHSRVTRLSLDESKLVQRKPHDANRVSSKNPLELHEIPTQPRCQSESTK